MSRKNGSVKRPSKPPSIEVTQRVTAQAVSRAREELDPSRGEEPMLPHGDSNGNMTGKPVTSWTPTSEKELTEANIPRQNIQAMIDEDKARRRTMFAKELQIIMQKYNVTLVAAFEYNPTNDTPFQGKVIIHPQ